jgi:methylphosphotriester-DNA--protein-cysteine methyltransferase
MFVASKNGKIVCKPECRHAQRIMEKNLLKYETLEQAIADGCRKGKCCFKGEK